MRVSRLHPDCDNFARKESDRGAGEATVQPIEIPKYATSEKWRHASCHPREEVRSLAVGDVEAGLKEPTDRASREESCVE